MSLSAHGLITDYANWEEHECHTAVALSFFRKFERMKMMKAD